MAGLGNLLNRQSGGDSNDDANTAQTDTNANESSENANGSGATAGQQASDLTRSEEAGLQGSNQPLAPNDTTVGHEESGDKEPVLIATSAPIQRFKIGRFQFDRAVLNLYNDDDAAEFRKMVEKLPPVDRNQIKIIDKEAAEAMVRPIEPGATKQFDSSVGRQRERSATGEEVIGKNPLDADVGGQGEKFAKVAQTDNNKPVDGVDSQNVANEINQGDVQSDAQIDSQRDANNS